MRFNSNGFKIILSVLIVFLFAGGCQKEVIRETDLSATNVEKLQSLFAKKQLKKKLTQHSSNGTDVSWVPDWNGQRSKMEGSDTYVYVPLIPQVQLPGGTVKVKAFNQRQYLVVKNGEEFLRITYITRRKITGTGDSIFQRRQFTGTRIVDNLQTNKRYGNVYQDGVRLKNNANGRSNGKGAGTSGYEVICHEEYGCSWIAYCSGFFTIVITPGCGAPPNEMTDNYGVCEDEWYLSEVESYTVCEEYYVPDPEDPGMVGGRDPATRILRTMLKMNVCMI